MEYVICLKWGGLHGDIALQQATGEPLYLLRLPTWRSPQSAVVDANGRKVLHVWKARRLLGTTYLIRSAGRAIGRAGSNWCWSHGRIELAGLPPVRCQYGWGMKSTLVLMACGKNVATIALQRGVGVRATLSLDDARFNEPRFLVGCALIFRDWTSRG